MKEVTIGQYYPAKSFLHRLDPRTKLIGTLIFVISVFFVDSWGVLIATAMLSTMIILSGVPLGYILKGLKAIWILLIITVLLNLFLTQGDILFQWGFLHITKQGVSTAFQMAIRLIYLIMGASLMTLTTTPNRLTDGMERLFRPLNKIHVPVHEVAMMMSIALRFVPILMEETDKIKKAQMARGADFEEGGLIKKVKAMIPLLVPLFVSAFRRANDLALAMEARCYHGGEGRTQMKPLKYQRRDSLTLIVLLIYLVAMIFVGFILKW